jgi:hypothetical protein
MMHDWSEQEEKMHERFSMCNDNNQGVQMTTVPTRASGTTRVHPESASQMTSSWLQIILCDAGRQRRRSNSKSSCRGNAHGIQVPIMRQSIATTSGGHSAIPAMTRRTCQWIKSPKRTTKGKIVQREVPRCLENHQCHPRR